MFLLLACFFVLPPAPAQSTARSSQPILTPDQGIDWSQAGVGSIPLRPRICAELAPTSTTEQINAALNNCPVDQTVHLGPGTYHITGALRVPSHVTLRGAGADKTILDAFGSGEAVIAMGSGDVPLIPRVIQSGAANGSTELVLGTTRGIAPGLFLAISETNDPTFVTASGSGGKCNWCDGGWSKDGHFARGQVVQITAVNGDRVTIAPGLYGSYTHDPFAIPFSMAVERAGVEDMQVRANDTGYQANFLMRMCAQCWLRGVESNYADGDHVSILWGFRDEIRDSYFSNAFLHAPGKHDSDIQIALKSTLTLIENNIIERTHDAVMLEWGAAGTVLAYNYTMGEFDRDAPAVVIGGIDFHGAHPQFTLIEGNVLTAVYADSVWGSSSQTTLFRNWVVGANRICPPLQGRGTPDCSAGASHYGWQAARAVQFSYVASHNALIGNIVGSAEMQSLRDQLGRAVPQISALEYPQPRPYEAAIGWTFGYGSANDNATGDGCGGGTPPCHAASTSVTTLLHSNYNNISKSIGWAPKLPRQLPASLYLPGRPAWWTSVPFPAIGPDITGGFGPAHHVYGNPAQACYLHIMGGSDGGPGSPLAFNAARCYPPSASNHLQKGREAAGPREH